MIANQSHFGDSSSFLFAIACIYMVTIGGVQIIDWVKGAEVRECSITVSDSTGNRHTFIGKGEVR